MNCFAPLAFIAICLPLTAQAEERVLTWSPLEQAWVEHPADYTETTVTTMFAAVAASGAYPMACWTGDAETIAVNNTFWYGVDRR